MIPAWVLSLLGGGWSFLKGAVNFCITKPGVYLAAPAALLSTVLLSHHIGYRAGIAYNEAQHVAAQAAVAHNIEIANIQFGNDVAASSAKALSDFLAANTRSDDFFNSLKLEVPNVVTAAIDKRYPLPCGLIRMWDAAALRLHTAEVESDRCQADDATAPTSASDLSRAALDLWHYADLLENQVNALTQDDVGLRTAWNAYVDRLTGGAGQTDPPK